MPDTPSDNNNDDTDHNRELPSTHQPSKTTQKHPAKTAKNMDKGLMTNNTNHSEDTASSANNNENTMNNNIQAPSDRNQTTDRTTDTTINVNDSTDNDVSINTADMAKPFSHDDDDPFLTNLDLANHDIFADSIRDVNAHLFSRFDTIDKEPYKPEDLVYDTETRGRKSLDGYISQPNMPPLNGIELQPFLLKIGLCSSRLYYRPLTFLTKTSQ
jgi:hypothetical protein